MNVRFPGLGLDFNIDRSAFGVFGLPVYWYGIIIALAFLLAVILAVKCSREFGIEPDSILDMVLWAAPTALVFSRLYYVVFSWDQYRDNLVDIFKVRDGGLAIYGAVIGALLAAWLYTRYKKIPFLKLADFSAPYLILGQSIGRWGNFINQEAFGYKTTLPWRMNGVEPDKYLNSLQENLDLSKWGVHPTFLYESLWDFAVFLFLLYFRKRKKVEGEVLFMYFILYGAGRFFIEGLRTDSLMLGSIRVSQLLSLLLIIVFIALFIYRRSKKAREEEPDVLGQSQYGSLVMKLKAEEEAEKEEAVKEAAGEAGVEEKEEKEGNTIEGNKEDNEDNTAEGDKEEDKEANIAENGKEEDKEEKKEADNTDSASDVTTNGEK